MATTAMLVDRGVNPGAVCLVCERDDHSADAVRRDKVGCFCTVRDHRQAVGRERALNDRSPTD
eukprot:10473502-Heterocapsa_arctica.AAC.1